MNIQLMNHDVHSPIFIRAKTTNDKPKAEPTKSSRSIDWRRPLHGDWCVFCLLIHCIIGSYFVYLNIKNSIIFLPWHTNPRIPMSM